MKLPHILNTEKLKKKMPFQIISVDMGKDYAKVDDTVARFFNDNYGNSSDSVISFYNKGWKDQMRERDGNAQITALHQMLAGLPTLVLLPKLIGEDEIVLDAAMWGLGDLSLPDNIRFLSIDLYKLRMKAVREELARLKELEEQYGLSKECLSDTEKKNMDIFAKELNIRETLGKLQMPSDEIEQRIASTYNQQYEIDREMESRLASVVKEWIAKQIIVPIAIVADYYFLTEYSIQPKVPRLFIGEENRELRSTIVNAFLKLLAPDGKLSKSAEYRRFLPFYQAATARSFIDAGDRQTAAKLQEYAIKALNAKEKKKSTEIIIPSDAERSACELIKKEKLSEIELNFSYKVTIILNANESIEFIEVKAGDITMRADDGENDRDEVPHTAFYIGETPVTQAQWQAVMGTTIEQQRDEAGSNYLLAGTGANYPMYYVSWHDAMKFCEKLNKSGKAPIGYHFTLPTETQWEYAAKGGKKSNGFEYSGSKKLDKVGWYYENSGNKTHEVGTKKMNELGLYDMSGNVWEWCLDEWTNGTRVCRGGSWCNDARYCRVVRRYGDCPSGRGYDVGFRVALAPGQN